MKRFPNFGSSRPITARLERKPVWILLTALAFCIIALIAVYGSTPTLDRIAPLNLAVLAACCEVLSQGTAYAV
jgi:hypothetical protein